MYTLGSGECGKLGHDGEKNAAVPRVVEGLAGQKVVGASAGTHHTVVWTEGGEVYTFGAGVFSGHGGDEYLHGGNEYLTRVVAHVCTEITTSTCMNSMLYIYI